MSFRYDAADTLGQDELAAAMNLVYTDYAVPVRMTPEQMRARNEQYDVCPDLSAVLVDAAPLDERIAGLSLLARRGARGWIGGFGIAPAYRRRGLSHLLLREQQRIAQAAGVKRIVLEVLATNHAAISTYLRGGFVLVRDLLILEAPVKATPAGGPHPVARAVDPAALLLDVSAVGAGAAPCWQREPESLRGVPLEALAVGDPVEPDGYALFRVGTGGIGLVHLSASTVPVAAALVSGLRAHQADAPLRLVNEPEDSETVPALRALGFRETMRQHELSWKASEISDTETC